MTTINNTLTMKEEIKAYKEIEEIFSKMNENETDTIIEAIGNYVWCFETEERRRAYQRVYRIAKKLDTTVAKLVVWFFVDGE